MDAQQREDYVMCTLRSLSPEALEGVCGVLPDVTVEDDMKGQQKALYKLVMKYLCNLDDDEAAVKLIYDHLEVEEDDKKVMPPLEYDVDKDLPDPAPKELSKPALNLMQLKDLKISGTIGGDKEKDVLTFDSLLYQVDNAKKNYPDHVICAAIIKAISPGKNIRSYLESMPELSLKDVMEFLKSHFQEKDSSQYFTDLQNATQESDESMNEFVVRLMCLRQKILSLSKQEGCLYDKNMFIGIRNENVRTELRERCAGDFSIKDDKLLKHVAEVMANENERKLKLNKKTSLSANAAVFERVNQRNGKKENPFTKIEELRVAREKDMTFMKAELAEIKNIIKSGGANINVSPVMPAPYPSAGYQYQNDMRQQKQQRGNGRGGGGNRGFIRKCPQCMVNNVYRCTHCFVCGNGEH